MTPDGTGIVQLTNGSFNWQPAWSPDGRQLAYTHQRTVDQEDGSGVGVYLMWADGSCPRQVAKGVAPAWSPDGKVIAAAAADGIWLLDAVTGEELSHVVPTDYAKTPSWSPDGSLLAYAGPWGGDGIDVVGADGSSNRSVAETTFPDHPSWSPDGTSIVFSGPVPLSARTGKDFHIYVVPTSGATPRDLGSVADYATSPTWRPNGPS
jgi:Tol biopolymer transport system component